MTVSESQTSEHSTPPPNVAAFTGASGAGKTTLICAVIAHYAARGVRVAAIKHTHHPLNHEHRGDTARFLDAGAERVLLAGEAEAVVFSTEPPYRVAYAAPADLLRNVSGAAIVFIEGFKHYDGWPRIEVRQEARPSVAAILLSLEDAWGRPAPATAASTTN
jgi:molybdopterin-guanine dinucleotide biosynthesis protein B